MSAGPPPFEKPTAAFILSLLSGVAALFGGLAWIGLATVTSVLTLGIAGRSLYALGAGGVAVGLVIIIAGVLMYVRPQHHIVMGTLILVLAIVSFFTSFFGGFLVGMILGIIGGALGIGHKPSRTVAQIMPQRICPKCGRVLALDARFCPQCGAQLG